MAQIVMTFSDQPDGLVDIQVYLGGIVDGAEPTPAMKMSREMLLTAQYAGVTDVEDKAAAAT